MTFNQGDKVKLKKEAKTFISAFERGHEFTVDRVSEDRRRVDLVDSAGERMLSAPTSMIERINA